MKKLMTMIGAVGLAFAATAAIDDALLTFSTVGPDKYSDGTTVLDGECYALVWTADGATFGGIAADGTAVAETDEIVLVAPVATGGHCPNVLFQIPAAQVDKGGTFGVYLLDTRVKAEDGTVAPAGLKANGKPNLVNGYGLATEATKVEKNIMNPISHHTDCGTAPKSLCGRCGNAKGTASRNDARNIHFMLVTTE